MDTKIEQQKDVKDVIGDIAKKEQNKRGIINNIDNNKPSGQTIEINVKEKDVSDTEKKTVNIKDSNVLKDFINQQPKKAPPKPKEEIKADKPKQNVEEVRKQIILDDKKAGEAFDIEDFELFSEFTIEALEMGTSTLFRWWALDTTDAPYEMTVKKKDKLKRLLTKILIRYSIKFPLVWLFLVTLIITHVTPFKKAKLHRKEVLKQRVKKLPPNQIPQVKQTPRKPTEVKVESVAAKTDNKDKSKTKTKVVKNPSTKRGAGGVSK